MRKKSTRGDRKVLRTVKLSRAEWLQLGAGIRIRHRLTFPCKNGYASCKSSHALGHSSVRSGARRTDADGLQRPVVSAGQQSNSQGENARKRRKLKFPHGSTTVGNLWSGR